MRQRRLEAEQSDVYFLYSSHIYSTYPGNGLNYIFLSGHAGLQQIDSYFLELLKSKIGIESINEVLNLEISLKELGGLILFDIRVLFGLIISTILKVMASLGFMHHAYLKNLDSSQILNLSSLLYFVVATMPSFIFGCLMLTVARKNSNYWFKNERLIVAFAVIFILIHSAMTGGARYVIPSIWILSLHYFKFIRWLGVKLKE